MPVAGLVLAVTLLPSDVRAANKEHEAIMREIQALQGEVQKLQKLDERVLELRLLIQQTLDMATKANTSVSVLERDMKDRMREQEKSLVGPVATLGTRIESMADEFRFVKENMGEVNSRIGKLQTQMKDLDETVKTLPALIKVAPPPPPDAQPVAPVAPGTDPAKPGASLQDLYDGARRDQLAGRYDLAVQGYNDILKFYGKSELACNAVFYLGDIHYRKEDLEKALSKFDDVIEKFDESCAKRPDAMYMKGKTLGKSGHVTEAARVYRDLKVKYPQREWVDKANAGLREMGLATGASTGGVRRKK